MKNFILIILSTILLNVISLSSLFAQTACIGHISAEVVEAVSISSNMVTNITIEKDKDYGQNSLDLGKIVICDGKSSNCNVAVEAATIISESGKTFALTPKTCLMSSSNNNSYNDQLNKRILLKGAISEIEPYKANMYKGSYTIILAYN